MNDNGEMRFIRAIKSKIRRDRIRNEEVRKGELKKVKENKCRDKLTWFSDIKRMNVDRVLRKIKN